jgi:hypothetical protein
MMSKGFSFVDGAYVDFYEGFIGEGEGVMDGDGGVSVCGGVDEDGVCICLCFVDDVDEFMFCVVLEGLCFALALLSPFVAEGVKFVKCCFSVEIGLSFS